MSQEKPAGRPMPGTSGHGTATVDVNERGADKDGAPQTMDRRLFMQLVAYRCPPELHPAETITMLARAVAASGVGGVVYEDVNDPHGLALLTFSEEPGDFVTKVRPQFAEGSLRKLVLRPELTMLGRSYSSGYESDLVYWLIDRPRQTCLNPAWPWAVWYPLRRSGAFEQLAAKEQGGILREHAAIGRAYGEQDLAHDVRLACHGLDQNDNEFVIGLIGKALHPLSHVVQTMRKTRQTSEYIAQMGPFFVGHAVERWGG
jgi:chlorite dismutase